MVFVVTARVDLTDSVDVIVVIVFRFVDARFVFTGAIFTMTACIRTSLTRNRG